MLRHTLIYIMLLLLVSTSFILAGTITNISDTLSSYASGDYAMHKISFKNAITIGVAGRITIVFNKSTTPPNQRFLLSTSNIVAVAFGNITPPPAGGKAGGLVRWVSANGDTLALIRDGTGGDIYGGSKIELYIALIKNPNVRRLDVTLDIQTWDWEPTGGGGGYWKLFDSGTSSPLFSIDGLITTFSFAPIASPQKAGQPFTLRITNARDSYNNPAAGPVVISAAVGGGAAPNGAHAIFDTVRVRNGAGQAQQILVKKENGVVLRGVSETGFTATTIPFDVSSGNATELVITGEPASAVAGVRFSNPITVTAYDSYGNVADTYAGTVSFNNSDPLKQSGDLPDPSTLNNGSKSFPGTQFLLRSAGDRKIWVSDGVLADTTRNIRVTSNTIHSFSISINSPTSVGQNTTVTVSNAVDAYGNPANGSVLLTFADGGDHAIGGYQPILPTIQVVNGSGSTHAIFFKAENVSGLRGTSIGGSQPQATTGSFTVNAGPLASLRFFAYPTDNPLPTNRLAGETLGSSSTYLRVEAKDAYTNTITNFTGSVYFTSTDNNAVLPYKQATPYTFTLGDNGVKDFARNTFSFRTAGFQNITVVSGSISQSLNPIQVLPNVISTFDLVVSNTQRAGQQFPLQVINAKDAYGNYGNGIAEIRRLVGGNNSPRGDVPLITNVPIFNGSGSANQILVKTEGVRLIGEVKEGGVVRAADTTATITVLPGSLGELKISGTPTWVVAGSSFPNNVTVKAFDAFGNDKTDYIGTIHFTSSDANPNISLPAAYNFSNTNIAIFSGSQFRLLTPGAQTIQVNDYSAGVQGISPIIDVSSLRINRVYSNFFRVNQGQQNVIVSMEVENLSTTKPLTGVIGELHFKLGGNIRDSDYSWERLSPTSVNLPPRQPGAPSTATLQFRVNANPTALTGNITVDGYAFGNFDGNPVSSLGAVANGTHSWLLQRPAKVMITGFNVLADTVRQGQLGVPMECDIVNGSDVWNAMAVINKIRFSLLLENTINISDSFQVTPDVSNLSVLNGGQAFRLKFYLNARYRSSQPPLRGNVYVYPIIYYADVNTNTADSASYASPEIFFSEEVGALQIIEMRASQSTVTAEQTAPWYIYIGIHNNSSAAMRINFNSTKTFIRLRRGGTDYTSHYQISLPIGFVEGGDIIEPDSIRHIRYTITRVGPETGTFSIYSRVETIDGLSVSDAFGSYEVQTPPDIRITRLIASQTKVTAGDTTHSWCVDAVVGNFGGSAVAIDSLKSRLIFSDGVGFLVKPPHLLHLPDVLAAGQIDTLRFKIVKNGTKTGIINIDASIGFRVINTSQMDSIRSAPNLRIAVQVQNPANGFISSVKVSQPFITVGTAVNWWVTVVLNNQTGSGDIEVNLDNNDSTYVRLVRGTEWQSGYVFSLPTKLAGSGNRILKAGVPDSLIFRISSMGTTTGEMKIVCRIGGVDINNAKPLIFANIAPETKVRIQLPANVTFIPNSLQPSYVSAGRYYIFQINAANTGESALVLDPLQTIFEFTDGNEVFSTRLDAAKVTVLNAYSTKTLYFNANYLPTTFSTGLFPTKITLRGNQNGAPYQQVFVLNDNRITIGVPQQLMINSLRAEVAAVTAGQQKPWTIRLELTNNGSNTLILDSARVAFYYGLQDITRKFSVSKPDTFINNGHYIRGQTTNVLRFTVHGVDPTTELGQIIISGRVWLSDSVQTFRHFDVQTDQGNAGAVIVQAPAVLRMSRLTASQNTVTRGQNVPWYVKVAVKNEGGSQIELLPDQTTLNFSKGNNNFAVQVPNIFEGSGSIILPPNAEDSLKFSVLSVNGKIGMLGACSVDAFISAMETNSDRVLSVNSQSSGKTKSITIQDSACVRIDSIKIDVPLKRYVNSGQRFYLKAKVHNPSSGDWVKQAQIAFFGGNYSDFVSGSVAVVDSIAAGGSKWTEPGVLVAAHQISNIIEKYHARIIGSVAHNTNQAAKVLLSANDADTSITVHFQRPGVLAINKVSASKDTIPSGYILPWYIYVDVVNTGQGALFLEKPSATDVVIKPGFVIEPPVLEGEDAILYGGETFRLVYTVTASSAASGPTMVTVRVKARDGNDPTRIIQPLTGQKEIFVSTTARARIAQTYINPEQFNVDESFAHVNKKQVFSVFVKVENNGGQDLDTVRVRLRATRSKVLPPREQVIEKLRVTEGYRQVVFNVQADSVENLIGETLVAEITKAVGEDLSRAIISPAQDSTVSIKIYQPALLRIANTYAIVPQKDKTVSYGQSFPIEVVVENLGSEPVRNISIRLQASPANRLQLTTPTLVIPGEVSGGDTGKVTFQTTANAISGLVSIRSSIIVSEGMNSKLPAPILTTGQIDSAFVIVESAAKLKITSVIAPEEVTAGDSQNNWRIYVNVENEGDADLKFIDISAGNITFITNGIVDKDYRVNAPAKLNGSDSLVLRGKQKDQLLYVVTRNGEIAGKAEIRVQLKAMDLNKEANQQNILTATGSTNISVSSVAWVRVNKTIALTNNKDINGRGLINRGRTFRIQVEAETGELSGVDSVKVRLTSNGRSFIPAPTFIIPNIPKGGKGMADFEIIADDFWDAKLGEAVEEFTATIESAKAVSSRLDAQIKSPERPEDAATTIRIQNPARVNVSLIREKGQDSVYTAKEEFNLIAKVNNIGTAPVKNGILRIILPQGKGYQLVSGSLERSVDLPLGVYSKSDTFKIRAPNGNSPNDTIAVQLVQLPLDVNDNRTAAVQNDKARVVISTLTSYLSLSFEIFAPNGAKDRIISTGQQILLRAIVETSANLREKSAKIILPTTPKYNLFGNSEVLVKQNPDTIIWNVQAPETETSFSHTFTAEVKGNSADGWQTKQKTVTIDQIVKRADLRLENFEVSYPIEGVMEGGQARFSVSQMATLRARVLNSGRAGVTGTGRLTLFLQQSGLRLLEADSTKPFIVGSFTTWNVMASETPITDLRDIRVEITTFPHDENTNMPAHVTSSFSTLITRTDERGTVKIDKFYISSPVGAVDNTLSTEQNFEVVAEISSQSVRDLMAELSWTGSFQSKVSPVPVPVGTRQQVMWTIKAPSEPSTNTISLTVTAKDYRSSTPLLNQTRNIVVITQEKTYFSLIPKISYPKNLTNKISSEVPFDLTLYIKHKKDTAPYYTTDETTVQIYMPASFSDGSESLIKSGRDSIVWHFKSPKVRQDTLFDFNFEIRGLPRDANSGLQANVDFMRVYYPIWVVKRAQLALNAKVNDFGTNDPVAIRVGNEFNIIASLENRGSADIYGEYQVRLNLPAGYTTKQTTQIRTDQKVVTWKVKAPDQSKERPDTITVKMLSAPWDYFSKAQADVVKDSAAVLVSPEAGIMVAKMYDIKPTSVTLKTGLNIPVLGLYLQNKDESLGSKSLLDTLIVAFRDRKGSPIAANSVVQRVAAVRHDLPYGLLAENVNPGNSSKVVLNFKTSAADTIKGNNPYKLDLIVDINPNTSLTDFTVAIDSASFIIARDATYRNRLVIADSNLNRTKFLGFTSGTMTIMAESLKESFCNYPNPFGTESRPITKFVYYLRQPSDIQLKIYTLTGDLVRSWYFTKTEHPKQTSQGIHQDDIIWDGKNGRGEKVMNGIYLAYLITEFDERALTKIAVVK